MVTVSKHMFDEACSHLECVNLVHPWARGCFKANAMSLAHSTKGSYQFYAYVYLIQIAMRGKASMSIQEFKTWVRRYVMSGVLGLFVSTTACTLNCIMRNLIMGKYSYYTFVLLPNTLNGLAIYLEPPGRRGLVINLFINLVIEFYVRWLERHGLLSVTPVKLTLVFMLGSSFLFYMMRLEGARQKRTQLLWLFTPERVQRMVRNNNEFDMDKKNKTLPCPHGGPCWKHVLKGACKLFAAGCAITTARVLLPKLNSPLRAFKSLELKHLNLALFFGCYIGIYRTVICLLCRKYGRDNALFAIPAGFLAGASFRWSPSLAFSIASVTGAFKLLSTILYERKMITERVPIPELLFCVCQGILFHARYMHPDVCPKYIFNLMSTVSNGCTEQIYNKMLEAVKKST